MYVSLVIPVVLLGSALAVPHDHRHHKHSAHHPQSPKYPSVVGTGTGLPTGAPIVTGTGAPHHNATAHHTIHKIKTLTTQLTKEVVVTAGNEPANSEAGTPIVTPEPLANNKHKVSQSQQAAAETCQVEVVTITKADTVTVTEGQEAATPSPSAAGEQQSEVETPESISQPAPASTSVAAPPVESHSPENVQSSKEVVVPPSSSKQVDTAPPSSSKEIDTAPASTSAAVPSSQPSASGETASQNTTPAKPATQQKGLPFRTKRGVIASTNTMEEVAKNFGVGKVSWMGNWYSAPPGELADSLQFVPQMYGTAEDKNGAWTKNAQKAVTRGDKYFLSFGEPGPGNPDLKLRIDVPTAVQLWKDKMEPYVKQGITIGSPCILQNSQDFDWLDQFIEACTDCTFGFVAIHWVYKADLEQVGAFKQTVERAGKVAQKLGVGVWVDNFYASGDADSQKKFLAETVPWLEEQEWVHAYAWVPSGHMTEGDALNDLGEYYANL